MRNLKRTLSLALAAVMLMGMMVVGAGAASSDFTDADEIKNVEAVDVMVGLGVLEGGDKGDFQPNSILTREQAAKIICYLLLGTESAEKLTTNSTVFNDVAADRWSAPYIGYCVNLGILAGDGQGNFFPEGKLTGAAFAKMLLVALGYDPAIEKYVGSEWMINVAADAIEAGISPKGVVLSNELSRQDAAQMAFQTLTADTVKYANKGTTIIGSDGMQVIVGNTPAEKITNSENNDYRTEDKDTIQQFCEKYFPDLEKDTKSEKNTADDFMRPGYTWVYDGDAIAFAAKTPVATYAGADFDKDAISDLKDDYKDVDTAHIYYNGTVDGNADALSELNRNGYNIEVYANGDDEVTAIIVTEAFFTQVNAVNTDDDDKVTDVEVTVYEAGEAPGFDLTIDVKDNKDAYALVKDLEEDDVFMGYYTAGWADGDADKLLAVDTNVETVDGKVTAKSVSGAYNGWLKIDGEKYEFAWEYSQAAVNTGDEGTFYLFNNYIVHYDGESAANSDDYLYVVRADEETGTWSQKSYYAEVVYADGTSEVIYTKDLATAGQAYAYKYNEKKDYYELSSAISSVSVSIDKGKTALDGTKTADSQTVYVSIKLDEGKFDSAKTYTGYKNVPSMDGKACIVADGKTADIVFIVNGTTSASADDLIYISGESVSAKIDDDDLGEYYTYTAVVGGEVVEIMVDADTENAAELNGLYSAYAVDDDNIYSDLKAATVGDGKDYLTTTGDFKKAANEVITVGDAGTMAYTDDVTVFVIAADGDITTGSITRNYSDNTAINYTVNSDGAVTSLYIVK